MYTLPEDAEAKGWGKDGGLEASSSLNVPFTTAAMVRPFDAVTAKTHIDMSQCIFHNQGNEYPPAKKSDNEWVSAVSCPPLQFRALDNPS